MTIAALILYTSIAFGTSLSLVVLEQLAVNRVEDRGPVLNKLDGEKQRHHSSSLETSGGE